MANTLRIKRRAAGGASGAPASLANAELAFNEQDDTLYYGKGTGGAGGTATTVEAIGGKGAFVNLTGTQSVSGDKTFSGTVVVPTPSGSTHAATKGYVDTEVATRIAASEKGANNGVATLDSAGKVPSSQLPAYVDDVLEYANLAGFPATGSTGVIYVAIDTGVVYRWSGSAYVVISSAGTADEATKLTTARSITASGDASWTVNFDGSANVSAALTLASSGVAAGTYNDSATAVRPFTVDAKGRITSIGTAVTIAPAFSSITTKPTTLSGYGITDAQPVDATLTALAGVATSADKLIYATGSDTFSTTDLTSFGRSLIDDADAAAGRSTLGLGTMATQAASGVAITGGSITNLTTFDGVTIDGGTF